MPKIVATDFNLQTADTTSTTVVLPPHQTGDVFFCAAVKDSVTTAGPTTATTGWFQGMATSTSTGGSTTAGGLCSWFVKVAASADEPDLVVTNTDTDSLSIIVMTIRGCGVAKNITGYSFAGGNVTYNSTAHGFFVGNVVNITGITPAGANGIYQITAKANDTFTVVKADPGAYTSGGSANCIIDAHGGNGTVDSTGAPYGVPGVTTNYDKSLCVYTMYTGGTGTPVPYPGLHRIITVDTGTEGVGAGYMVQRTAGASGTFNFYTDAVNSNNLGVCVAFRDSGTGYEMPYLDSDWATLIHPFRGSGAIITGDAWGTALTNYPTSGKCAVTACFQEDSSGGPSYVTYTTEANNATDADVIPYPASEVAGASGTGDTFLIGHTKPFCALTFDTLGCTAGVAGVVAWEYWNGASWTAFASVTDGTTSFTAVAADGLQVRWAMPANFNWTPKVINGSASLYFARARCTTVWTTNPTISQVYIGGFSLVYDAVGASTDAGVVQFENAANITGAINASQISGTYIDLGQTVSLAGSIICGTYQFTLPRDYVDSGQYKEGGGVHLMVGDTSFNRKAWCIGSYLDALTNDAQRNRFAIQWAQSTDTTHSRTTTDPTDTIADVFIGNRCIRGAGSVAFSHMLAAVQTNIVVNGGSSTYPITVAELIQLGNASPVQLFRDYSFMVPVTFGGSGSMHADLYDFTFTFPPIATPWSDPYNVAPSSAAHYDSGTLGFIFDARSGDTMKMRNGKIASDSPWQFTVTATASSGASWDFDGMLIVNANVTLYPVFTWNNIKWQSCPVFNTTGSTITNNTFVNTMVGVTSPANAALISTSTFTKTTGTQHGIEISGTAADFSLNGCTFTGYAASDGSTGNEAIYVNIATGSMTITITGGGSTPSIRTAGATVTVSNPIILRINIVDADGVAITANCEVTVVRNSDTTILFEEDNVIDGTVDYTYNSGGGTVTYINVLNVAGYQPKTVNNYTLPSTAGTTTILQIQLDVDTFYSNPA